MSASITPVGAVRTVPVIPKHKSIRIMLNLFLSPAVWQPGHQSRDAKVMDGPVIET